MNKKITTSVIGASGFTGRELVRLLSGHPEVEIKALYSRTYKGSDINEVHPELKGVLSCVLQDPEPGMIPPDSNVVFLAMPHTKAAQYAAPIIKVGLTVIDLSADYRFKSAENYSRWYDAEHPDAQNLQDAVYGIPEINRASLKDARLIANPGCYATSVILALYPLVAENLIAGPVYADSKSGISGAGRKVEEIYTYIQRNENLTPYKVNEHRHMGEISEFLQSLTEEQFGPLIFCPHLVPMDRGILSNMYLKLKGVPDSGSIADLYSKYYSKERFIDLKPAGTYPQTKDVVNTNNCAIGFKYEPASGTLIVISAIDNLLKGASGQAIQNMNAAMGIAEEKGLL